jgi:hypothetical protein
VAFDADELAPDAVEMRRCVFVGVAVTGVTA